MEYYLVLKRNEPSNCEKTWRKLKCILLSERSQYEKSAYYMIPNIPHSEKGKTTETVKRSEIPGEWAGIEEFWNGTFEKWITINSNPL